MRIEISGDTATIHAPTHQRSDIARRLIEAAGRDQVARVRTVTGGAGLAFSVPVGIADAAGLLPKPVSEPAEKTDAGEVKPKTTRTRTRKTEGAGDAE
ncbi:hypothetical protein [Nocardia farcinica]|uniref:hypothetical protein n=1 Tax=Nocardia farcinica TaxID=37329 RepID=UPI0024540072|nr:hypothetical protein [Nocardia farcinica]